MAEERKMSKGWLAINAVLIAVLLGWLGWRANGRVASHTTTGGDQGHFLVMGFNLAHFGVFSRDVVDATREEVAPTAYREPLYPWVLSKQIQASESLRSLSGRQVVHEPKHEPKLVLFQQTQVVFLMLTALCIGFAGWVLTGSILAWYVGMLGVATSETLLHEMTLYRPELFTAMLTSLATVTGILWWQRKSIWWAGFHGCTAALLALTKGIFQYYGWGLLLCLAVVWCLQYATAKQRTPSVKSACVCVGLFVVTLLPWYVRNYIYFDRLYFTSRGGIALYLRSKYDSLSWEEYRAAYLYWTPYPGNTARLERSFDTERVLQYLDRSRPQSFYRQARSRRQDLLDRYKDETHHAMTEADKAQMKEATGYIVRHPLRHLAWTVPIGLRGLFIERNVVLGNLGTIEASLANTVLAGSFFLCLLGALLSGWWGLALALFPGLYCWGMYSLVSHNLPRYNYPVLPQFWLAFAVVVGLVLRYGMRSWQSGAKAE